jgi:hypothetical protein
VIFSYRAYGVTLSSEHPILALSQEAPELGGPEIALSLGSEPDWVEQTAGLIPRVEHPSHEKLGSNDDCTLTLTSFGFRDFFQLDYNDGVRFVLDRAAQRLWGTFRPPLAIQDLESYLVGPVLGFVLRQRGVVALHASSVCIEGESIAFCGASGAGKSTLAAAFALRGVPVLSEDIVAINERDDTFFVQPGYPRICLWPDSVERLLGTPAALPQLTPTWGKRFLPLDGAQARFEQCERPLQAIYLLSSWTDERTSPRIEALNLREALLHLVQNTYMNWLLDQEQRARELDVLARIVERVSVRRIVGSERTDSLCDLIIDDLRGGSRTRSFMPLSHR